MKIYIKGGAEVSLTKADFVAEGGEGQVYARGPIGYKIYHDTSKAIPLGKIQELSGITGAATLLDSEPDSDRRKPDARQRRGGIAQHWRASGA